VWIQKVSIPSPWMVIGNSEGSGLLTANIYKGKYKARLEIPGGFKEAPPWGRYGYFLEPHYITITS